MKMGSEEEVTLTRELVNAIWEEMKVARTQGFDSPDEEDADYRRHVGGELWARYRFLLIEAGIYTQE